MKFRREKESVSAQVNQPDNQEYPLPDESGSLGIYRIEFASGGGKVKIECARTDYDFFPIFNAIFHNLRDSLNRVEAEYLRAINSGNLNNSHSPDFSAP